MLLEQAFDWAAIVVMAAIDTPYPKVAWALPTLDGTLL